MAGPTKKELNARAKDLDVEVDKDATNEAIADAILAAKPDDEVGLAGKAAASPSSGKRHPDEGAPGAASDDEVREREAAAIREQRGGVNVIDVPARAPVNTDAPRASERGVYRDGNGDRRVVAAGDVIPPGWEKVNDAPSIAERTKAARETRQEHGSLVDGRALRGPRGR